MKQNWRPLALVTQLGLTMATSLVLSLLAGLWLDGRLGTRPLFTLVCSLIGMMAGALGIYRLVTASIAEAVDQATPAGRPGSRASTGESRTARAQHQSGNRDSDSNCEADSERELDEVEERQRYRERKEDS